MTRTTHFGLPGRSRARCSGCAAITRQALAAGEPVEPVEPVPRRTRLCAWTDK